MISIITPVYNRKGELSLLLESLKNERRSGVEFEIIIIDDDSDDGSFEVAEKFCRENNYGTLIRSGYRSPGISRNLGAEVAKNEWLLYCDSDNQLIPGWSLILKKAIRQYQNFEGIWFPAYSENNALTSKRFLEKGTHVIDPNLYFKYYIGEVVHCIKREFLLNHKYFYLEGHSNDFPDLLWLDLFTKYNVIFFDHKIQNYSLISENRISTDFSVNKVASQLVHYSLVYQKLILTKYKHSRYAYKIILKLIFFSLIVNPEFSLKYREYIKGIYPYLRFYQKFRLNYFFYKMACLIKLR